MHTRAHTHTHVHTYIADVQRAVAAGGWREGKEAAEHFIAQALSKVRHCLLVCTIDHNPEVQHGSCALHDIAPSGMRKMKRKSGMRVHILDRFCFGVILRLVAQPNMLVHAQVQQATQTVAFQKAEQAAKQATQAVKVISNVNLTRKKGCEVAPAHVMMRKDVSYMAWDFFCVLSGVKGCYAAPIVNVMRKKGSEVASIVNVMRKKGGEVNCAEKYSTAKDRCSSSYYKGGDYQEEFVTNPIRVCLEQRERDAMRAYFAAGPAAREQVKNAVGALSAAKESLERAAHDAQQAVGQLVLGAGKDTAELIQQQAEAAWESAVRAATGVQEAAEALRQHVLEAQGAAGEWPLYIPYSDYLDSLLRVLQPSCRCNKVIMRCKGMDVEDRVLQAQGAVDQKKVQMGAKLQRLCRLK
eukprot:1137899-Pelagomonas_calceolata.AAC.6